MCACANDRLCQWCRKVIHACREIVVPYAAKRFHLACWDALRSVAQRTGGVL